MSEFNEGKMVVSTDSGCYGSADGGSNPPASTIAIKSVNKRRHSALASLPKSSTNAGERPSPRKGKWFYGRSDFYGFETVS